MEIRKKFELTGHKNSIYGLTKGVDENSILSLATDNLLVSWDIINNENNVMLVQLKTQAYSMVLYKETHTLLVGNTSGGIHVIDLNDKEEKKLIQAHDDAIYEMKIFHDKGIMVITSGDGSFSLWSLKDFSLIKKVKLSNNKLRAIGFNPNTEELYISSSDGTTRVIGLNDLNQKHVLNGGDTEKFVPSLAYNANKNVLVTGSRGYLCFWDAGNNYELLDRIAAHQFAIYNIVFNSNYSWFATSSLDKTIRIWRSSDNKLLTEINKKKFDLHTSSVNRLLWLEKKKLLISASDDRKLMVWSITE